MKKFLPLFAVVLIVVLAAAIYVYSERLMPPDAGPRPQAPAASRITSEAPAVGDDHDGPSGAAALFWRDPSSGANTVWRFGAGIEAERHPVQALDTSWKPRVFAPAGWGGDDLLIWRNDSNGQLRAWRLSRDGEMVAFSVLPYSGDEWHIVAARDADADGDADLVWIGPRGTVAVWTLQDGEPEDKQTIGVARNGWELTGAVDADGDGRVGLLWRNPEDGRMVLWDLNGTAAAVERELPGVPLEWSLIGVAGIDGDGGEDLLWRNPAGALAIWRGLSAANALLIRRTEAAGWEFSGLADVDDDGRAELLWRHRGDDSMGAWSIADDGRVRDLGLPRPPADADRVPSGFVAF